MEASRYFHRNVFLLTQLVEPNDDFKKYFREGMFDKPNTAGFIYVSHYLLMIYNAERFKKLTQWPVTCKKTEAKYRNDVRDYLTAISSENPDIGFPAILASHLLHASGIKFTIIMWKLSEVVVRTYISRETDYGMLSVPKAGITSCLSKRLLQETSRKINMDTLTHHTQFMCMQQDANSALKADSERLRQIKTEIFETEKLITSHASSAPVHPSIKKRLMDVNDKDIISIWKSSINKSWKHLEDQNFILKQIENLSEKICNLLISNSSDEKVLDAKQLARIDASSMSESFPHEIQCLLYHVYKDDKLILHNFMLLFNLLLKHLLEKFKSTCLIEFSHCISQLEACCEDMKSMLNYSQTTFSDIVKNTAEMQNILSRKRQMQVHSDNTLPIMSNVHLLESPHIILDTDSETEKTDLQKRLELTPVEGAHKALFSRYRRVNQNQTTQGSKLRSNLLVSRINFDDTISMNNSNKQVSSRMSIMMPKHNVSVTKQSEKYSRLFSTRSKKNNRAADTSTMSLPSSSNANSTAIGNAVGEMPNISELSLDMTTKSISSLDEYSTPEKNIQKKDNKSKSTGQKNSSEVYYPVEINKPELRVTNEIIISNDENNCIVQTEKRDQRRHSIGDLVERYKRYLDHRNHTPSPKISHIEYEDE